MRRSFLASLFLLTAVSAAFGQASAPAGQRTRVPLLDNWKFFRGTSPGAEAVAFADDAWEKISIPHTWNATDGQDGGNNYFRGDGWYRRHVTVDASMQGKQLYLRFEAINRKADIYVNGTLLGSHAGGQAAICMDATKLLKAGDNVIAVRANNAMQANVDIPPLQADFTFYGGIYRPAELIAVSPVHISLTDFGSSGVYVSTPEVTAASAKVRVRGILQNAGAAASDKTVRVVIKDAQGKTVGSANASPAVAAGQVGEFAVDVTVPSPHLWNGRADPYLYSVEVMVHPAQMNESIIEDAISQPLGIRTFSIDPQKGFILNGKPLDLRGVNRHQDRLNKGWALSEADHLEDMALIKEMGCNSVRLAHYQHSEFFYQLCDKEGMIVWAEIPVVDKLGTTGSAFHENARQQYIELIRQNFNHPSIAFWSAGNEVDDSGGNLNRNGPEVYGWFKEMSALGKKEDPSRLTASAWREKFFPPEGTTDVIGLNEYLGWYTVGSTPATRNRAWEDLEAYIADHSNPSRSGRPGIKGGWAVTEYGAGSSIYFHAENPVNMDHSEEYESLLHENTWKVFAKHPEIWGKYVWNMFDFAVDGRAEGDHAGRNDKGLVTYDRKTKKDAFYFYKAVWSDEPSLQIASKRFATRGIEKIPVKIYTNAAKVTLTVNGTALGEKTPENGTIVWEGVTLKQGDNDVKAVGTLAGGKSIEDTCKWVYTPGAPATVFEAQDQRMRDAQRNAGRGR